MTQTNPSRPWAEADAVLQLANDIDPYKRSAPPSVSLQYVVAEELRARAECPQPGAGNKPMFWYRPRADGGYDGPLHDEQIEDVRKRSGAWIPLCAGYVPPASCASVDRKR